MAAPVEAHFSSEMVDEWSQYLDPSQRNPFQKSCAEADEHAIQDVLKSFFGTWKTTLMGSSLDVLKAVASDDRLRPLVETIEIQDECTSIDPWTASDAPSKDVTYDIWPRNDDGTLESGSVGIADLAALLRQKRLQPGSIKIRDYGISKLNLNFCPETMHARDKYRYLTSGGRSSESVAALLGELIEDSSLAVTSLLIQFVHVWNTEDSFYGSPRFQRYATTQSGISSPSTYDAVATMSPEHQGQNVGFSMLRSADLDLRHEASGYWLERLFYQATSLATLTLYQLEGPRTPPIDPARVVPHLTEFTLKHTTMSADAILAMLAASRESLKSLVLWVVTLENGSKWRELLLALARSLSGLSSFRLINLEEKTGRVESVDFRDLQQNHLPEECRSGLGMTEAGYPDGGRRVSKILYNGPNAGKVLEIAASVMIDGITSN